MDRTTAYAISSGTTLLFLSIWATLRYGITTTFLISAGIAGGIVSAPTILGHAKFHLRQSLSGWKTADENTILVSSTTIRDRSSTVEQLAEVLKTSEVGEVKVSTFSEGDGLKVRTGGFHNTYVRLTSAGQVTITGISETSETVADMLATATKFSFEPTNTNPHRKPAGIKGAPRVVLLLCLTGALIIGAGGVVNAAYPTDDLNTAEKTILLSFDFRTDFDPTVSERDARLGKAAFLVTALEEKKVEIQWSGNDSEAVQSNAQEALSLSTTARTQLRSLRQENLSRKQTARIAELTTDLRHAERDASTALKYAIAKDVVDETTVRPIQRELAVRADANLTGRFTA